jgi:Ca2+-binding EF-hand superfamily protein
VGSNLTELFKDFDSGEKGYLSEKDFREFIDEYGGDDLKDYTKDLILKHMDQDNNKRIQLGEFIKAFEAN